MPFDVLIDMGGFMDPDREERYFLHKFPGTGFRYAMGKMSRETFLAHCRYLYQQQHEQEQQQIRESLSDNSIF